MLRRLSPLLALLLVVIAANPAEAATLKREFRASIGSGGANGITVLSAWTSGTGTLAISAKSLKANASYRIVLRKGSCANPKTILGKLGSVATNGSGAVTTSKSITKSQMSWVWWARTGKITAHFISGSSHKCATFWYHHATRVVIPRYDIDLAVVKGPNGYPYCNVAMYMRSLYQPTEPGVTFIYAHARTGMFLPLLNASKKNNGAAMIGREINVYTTDSRMHTYRITKVRRHVRNIDSSLSITDERLWLQTSEGPNSSYPKLIVVADRVSSTSVGYNASHPNANPKRC
jgi:sortase (surface protein transpeptidase)